MVGTVDDPLAGLLIFQGVAGGADNQLERSLLPVYAQEPGHHGGLQGVQSVIIDTGDDPLPSATP